MKTFANELALPSLASLIGLLGAFLLLSSACSSTQAFRTHPMAKTPVVKPTSRCKLIGRAKTPNVAVLVERDCLKNGLTTVNIVVLNTAKKGTIAAEDSIKLITNILGFVPHLKLMFYGRVKGYIYYMCAATEQ